MRRDGPSFVGVVEALDAAGWSEMVSVIVICYGFSRILIILMEFVICEESEA